MILTSSRYLLLGAKTVAKLPLGRDRLLMRGAIPLLEFLAIDCLFKLRVFGLEGHKVVDGGFEHELCVTSFGSNGLLIHSKLLALLCVHARQAFEWLAQLLAHLTDLLLVCLTADRA